MTGTIGIETALSADTTPSHAVDGDVAGARAFFGSPLPPPCNKELCLLPHVSHI